MRYFDLHCDTATALYDRGETLKTSTCQISAGTISHFDVMTQVFAVFSKPGMSNEDCYRRFFKVVEHLKSDPDLPPHILSVEDARLLDGDAARLDALYSEGVRILTPLWSGVTCVGGSFDTDEGLSPFGFDVIEKCFDLGITPDVSHASRKSTSEIIRCAEAHGTAVIASHSDSYEVCPHPRNLTDSEAKEIAALGGVVGICLHTPHLGGEDVDTVLKHIAHFVNLIGEDGVCLGCDLDGTDKLPGGIKNQADVIIIAEEMEKQGFGKNLINKVFYENANAFFEKRR